MNQNEVLNNISEACHAFAEIVYELQLNQSDVWRLVKWHLAHIANEDKDDKDTIKTVANRAGIDRNSFSKFIKNPPPKSEPSNLATLITVVSSRSQDGVISIVDFMKIASETMKSSLTPQKALKELMKKDVVDFVPNSATHIIVKNEGIYTKGMSQMYLRLFSITMQRVIRTLLHNKDANIVDQLFHVNFYSSQMPLNEQKEFMRFTKKTLRDLRQCFRDKIKELENPELPIGAFSEVGVSLFQTHLLKSKYKTKINNNEE